MLLPFVYTTIVFVGLSIAVILLLSVLVQPKAKHLSSRKIPLKRFRLLGRISLVGSIILALMVLPSTITMASAYSMISNDYALWESFSDAVRISFNDVDGLYDEYWMPKVESLFVQMTNKDNLCLSMAIDRSILLDKIVVQFRKAIAGIGINRFAVHGVDDSVVYKICIYLYRVFVVAGA